jgi:hypothetical protein
LVIVFYGSAEVGILGLSIRAFASFRPERRIPSVTCARAKV